MGTIPYVSCLHLPTLTPVSGTCPRGDQSLEGGVLGDGTREALGARVPAEVRCLERWGLCPLVLGLVTQMLLAFI